MARVALNRANSSWSPAPAGGTSRALIDQAMGVLVAVGGSRRKKPGMRSVRPPCAPTSSCAMWRTWFSPGLGADPSRRTSATTRNRTTSPSWPSVCRPTALMKPCASHRRRRSSPGPARSRCPGTSGPPGPRPAQAPAHADATGRGRPGTGRGPLSCRCGSSTSGADGFRRRRPRQVLGPSPRPGRRRCR